MASEKQMIITALKKLHDASFTPGVYEHSVIGQAVLLLEKADVQKWIPVTERLPEEHDSIFTKWYRTERWRPGMYCTVSNEVIACVEIGSRTRLVVEAHTKDGKWNVEGVFEGRRVTHWMPLPEPPKGE